ncbi:MAG: hypothetical protein LLF28_02110 [Nitrospiraceae bacterium]|nr:hypothetical protein [Nitrospiraceae bacterium]
MKKTMAIILSLVLIVAFALVVSGCKKAEQPKAPEAPVAAPAAPEKAPAAPEKAPAAPVAPAKK